MASRKSVVSNMSEITLRADMATAFDAASIEVFNEAVSRGATFNQALTAVFLTGLAAHSPPDLHPLKG